MLHVQPGWRQARVSSPHPTPADILIPGPQNNPAVMDAAASRSACPLSNTTFCSKVGHPANCRKGPSKGPGSHWACLRGAPAQGPDECSGS